MKIALLCGGPSLERGISLNSARSVLDHLASWQIEIVPFYFDQKKQAYKISRGQLYSNTPSDFDFKLAHTAKPLTEKEFILELKKTDICFPVMHGPFGEDGEIQSLLEKNNIPFVGSDSEACFKCFDKFDANGFISQQGFFTLPSMVAKIYHKDNASKIKDFFRENKIGRAVVKPAAGGSSISVFSVNSAVEASEKTELIFSKRIDTRVVIEPFAEGIEFTTIILQNKFGLPVAIIPTEIEADYQNNQIFDFRKKYLPTRHVTYHCPPRFDNETIERIQTQAEQLFAAFGMRDFARFDGWVLNSGEIWFSDFNPISGMEQNSFLFQQASRIGLTHRQVLSFILEQACQRYGIAFPKVNRDQAERTKKKVGVVFGGATSERQVSLMSGTNVWLKLLESEKYAPTPYLLDLKNRVWELPYSFALNHTVEEIVDNCLNAGGAGDRLRIFEKRARMRLGLSGNNDIMVPKPMTLEELTGQCEFVFNGLHGGFGENGDFQKLLSGSRVKFNGSSEAVSRLCMNKFLTNLEIEKLNIPGVSTTKGVVAKVTDLENMSGRELRKYWQKITTQLAANTLIGKPLSDGCSSGVVRLFNADDLQMYVDLSKTKAKFIPKNTFRNQNEVVEMPLEPIEEVIFEKFIETDSVKVKNNQLKHLKKSGWIEITVGVIEESDGFKVLNPSITVSEGEVLSVEEKFQGGTGVNITPPPVEIIKPEFITKAKKLIENVAVGLGLAGYARIDAFLNVENGDVMIIEINTLPGLTPSTVFFHQGIAEETPLYPRSLLEKLIENKDK